MGNKVTALLLGNAHLGASDDRASQGGSKQVPTLVDSVALDGTEAQLIHKLLLEILNDPAISSSAMNVLSLVEHEMQ